MNLQWTTDAVHVMTLFVLCCVFSFIFGSFGWDRHRKVDRYTHTRCCYNEFVNIVWSVCSWCGLFYFSFFFVLCMCIIFFLFCFFFHFAIDWAHEHFERNSFGKVQKLHNHAIWIKWNRLNRCSWWKIKKAVYTHAESRATN